MTGALLGGSLREELRAKAEHAEDLAQCSVDERPAGGETRASRLARRRDWYRQLEDVVLDLVNALPAGTEDYEARQLFVFLTKLRRALDDDRAGADEGGEVRLACMQMRDVLRRLERRLDSALLDDPQQAARFVFEQLDLIGATELARLLGVSTKTVGAWRAGKPVRQRVERVKLVAQLVSLLRSSMTQTGVVMWFDNPSDRLAARSPLQLIDDDVRAAWEPLLSYARGGRAQLAV